FHRSIRMTNPPDQLGAHRRADGSTTFRVWAPKADRVDLHLLGEREQLLPMTKRPHGYYDATVNDVPNGTRYWYRLDGDRDRPDPASRSQPDGVHGPSAVFDPRTLHWSAELWRV